MPNCFNELIRELRRDRFVVKEYNVGNYVYKIVFTPSATYIIEEKDGKAVCTQISQKGIYQSFKGIKPRN